MSGRAQSVFNRSTESLGANHEQIFGKLNSEVQDHFGWSPIADFRIDGEVVCLQLIRNAHRKPGYGSVICLTDNIHLFYQHAFRIAAEMREQPAFGNYGQYVSDCTGRPRYPGSQLYRCFRMDRTVNSY